MSQQAPTLTTTTVSITTTAASAAAAAAAAATVSFASPSPSPSLLFPQNPPSPASQVLAYPITRPTTDSGLDLRAEKILSTATHVLATEATALSCLSRLYATDPQCRHGFLRAVEATVESQKAGGKIVVIGVGKSGKIGQKLVSSMNSLGLMTIFLNPVEALHGDLGIVRKVSFIILAGLN